MPIINNLLQEETKTEIQDRPSTLINQITELLREINQLLNNPNISNLIGKQQLQQQPVQQIQQIQQQKFTVQDFINFIQTQEGREVLISGLEKVKEMFGDLKISEMINLLKQQNITENESKLK